MTTYCYWCHEPLPLLPENATYVETINHIIHPECRDERAEVARRRESLIDHIATGSMNSIPDDVRAAMLERVRSSGFSRRCACLYDPAHGFRGYDTHSYADDGDADDYDERNAVDGCELCGGSGTHDPTAQLLRIDDDNAAAAWVAEHLPKSSGPCDRWTGFPQEGWHYDALGYDRGQRGVIVYNARLMLGGIITWLDLADLFRPRRQSSLF